MQFLNPEYLWWLLLGIIPVMLYLFRRKSKKVSVSTLVFFKTLAREHQESAWLRRLKKWLSFALTMLILGLAVFILARLIAPRDDADRYQTVVILLDRSASMALEDDKGESRLEAAKRILGERLKNVPEEVGVSLIAYDVRPEVLQPRTLQRRELVSRLDEVEIRPMAGRSDSAFESAQIIAALKPPTAVWHVSDQPLFEQPESDDAAGSSRADLTIRELNVALPEVVNPAITAFQIRPVPLEYARYDVYAQVALNQAAPEGIEARLNVTVGGIPSQYREIDLEPGERTGITFRINGSRDQLLRIHLAADADDFDLDNHVALLLPDTQPILAAWIRPEETEDPYTRFALSSIQESGSFELLKGTPEAWPLSESVDAVIFDGWLPDEWPGDIPAIVINPPGSVGPVQARRLESPVPYDSVRVGNQDHPLLFRVGSSRVAVTQTAVFDTGGALEPLWIAGREPVLAAGEVDGQRLVLMGFSPGISERLPLTASFPLLVGNALFWCVDQAGGSPNARLHSTGDFVRMEGESVTWSRWNGREMKKQRLPLLGEVAEMDRIGVWETDAGLRGASHILSARESDIPVRADDAEKDLDYFTVEAGWAANLKLWLLAAVIVFLLTESWLFHRHAVH
ncbi:MAG: BatA and WFA domain-containing protein [Verrucomicrobiales bacterium]